MVTLMGQVARGEHDFAADLQWPLWITTASS
jgi:hypothetical protein